MCCLGAYLKEMTITAFLQIEIEIQIEIDRKTRFRFRLPTRLGWSDFDLDRNNQFFIIEYK